MIVAALLMLADAPTDTKTPHRIAIEHLALTAEPTEVAACAARMMSRKFRVTSYPLPDGTGMDFALEMMLKLYSGDPSYFGYQFRKDGAGSYFTALYRHPFTRSAVVNGARETAKTCFPSDWNAWAKTNGQKLLK